jgi:hypothetical protein
MASGSRNQLNVSGKNNEESEAEEHTSDVEEREQQERRGLPV